MAGLGSFAGPPPPPPSPARAARRARPTCCADAGDGRERVAVLRGRVAAAAKLERFGDARLARDELHVALAQLSDRERVEEATALFYGALRDADLDSMCARWADDPSVSCVSPFARLAVGKPAVEDQWMNIFRYGSSFLVDYSIRSITLKPSCAWAVVDQSVQSVRGKEVIAGACVATNIFRRSGAEWLLLHHHAAPIALDREIEGEEVQ